MSDELPRIRSLFKELERSAPEPPIEKLRDRIAAVEQPDTSWFARAWGLLRDHSPRPPELAFADTGDILPESTPFAVVPALLEDQVVSIGLTRAPEASARGTLEIFVMVEPRVLEGDREYELWAITADGPLGEPVKLTADREVRASFPLPEKLRLQIDPRTPATWPFRFVVRPITRSR